MSNRLILTRQGQLFCQGVNLRHFIDAEIDKNQMTKQFISCTDVFPIDEGDKIIDVAAGGYTTVVVTEQGNCWMSGYCKQRRCYGDNDETEHQIKPPYQIDLPGKALKCWTNKTSSHAYVLFEDESGAKKIYSGVEYLNHYDSDAMRLLGQGEMQ